MSADTSGHHTGDGGCFERRSLRRYAGLCSLWTLGVGAVNSGHFSGWNLALGTHGWGGMFIATRIIAVMYFGLAFSIAEMSPALPHTGGTCSFAQTRIGRITGVFSMMTKHCGGREHTVITGEIGTGSRYERGETGDKVQRTEQDVCGAIGH